MGDVFRSFMVRDRLGDTRDNIDSRLDHGFLRIDFRSHQLHRGNRWTDEFDVVFLTHLCKLGVLRHEPIPRMDSLSTCFQCHIDDLLFIQVTLTCWAGSDVIFLVSVFHEQRLLICI